MSREYDDGNALHIAARSLALDAIRVLLRLDCDPHLEDSKSLKPVECMPQKYGHIQCESKKILEIVDKIHQEFDAFESMNVSQVRARRQSEDQKDTPRKGRHLIRRESGSFTDLEALGFRIGDRVFVNKRRQGVLRFFGKTEFQSGLWAGVELDESVGKNDGSLGNYRYFACKANFGVFCAASKLSHIPSPEPHTSSSMETRERSETCLSDIQSLRPCSAASSSNASNSVASPFLEVGANVTLAGGKKGVIRFFGEVKFNNGLWVSYKFVCYVAQYINRILPGNLGYFKLNKKMPKFDNFRVKFVAFFESRRLFWMFVTIVTLRQYSVK